ncbi:MAG TPA: hypothetical protein VF407_24475 [Polyangiaceae bacterium]
METLDAASLQRLRQFFNDKHEIVLCSANERGEPNAAIMGSCRLAETGEVEFEISEPVDSPALTFDNIRGNPKVMFLRFIGGPRARDYRGLRIYADVVEIETSGARIEAIRRMIAEKHGEEKAAETRATVRCRITLIRPVLDRGQGWESSIT